MSKSGSMLSYLKEISVFLFPPHLDLSHTGEKTVTYSILIRAD